MYDVEKLLSSIGIKPTKKLSQNFLVDEDIVDAEVDFADLRPEDTVLDIGAGLGFLTEKLSERAGKVIAVEMDKKLAAHLKNKFVCRKNVLIMQGDIIDLINNMNFNKIVANIPYEISSPITFSLVRKCFDIAIICYQKEFAQRMVAKPGTGEYSRLSVMTAYFANASILMDVPKRSFYPQPKIDSAIVSIKPKNKKPYEVIDEEFFFKITALLFQHKKQTVRNALVHSYRTLKADKKELKSLKLPFGLESRRVFTLEGEEIAKISGGLEKIARSY